jgi:putative molybdopterin biosynthesis protein
MSRTRYLNKKPLDEALRLFVEELSPATRPADLVPVEESRARVTAEPVFARISVPHYHGAAMDGIAVRAEDTFGASEARAVELVLAADAAGETHSGVFLPVDTGQPLPRWANAVVMIENVYPAGEDRLSLRAAAVPWQHVRLVGEDIVATEPLLPRGHRIRPFDIGALLAAGHTTVPVAARPSVAIIPTGTEIVEPGEPLPPGAIVEFNSRMIAAFVDEWGGVPHRMPRVPDELGELQSAVADAVQHHDVVLVIAGSSAGEHDYTATVLERLGTVLTHGIDVMPGKPAICARVGATPVLGVPGYPVSAVVVCRELLRPLLAKLLGTAAEPPETVRAVVSRKLPSHLGLEEFLRVTLGRVAGRVVANPLGRGAGAITSLVRADGFLRIPTLSEGINAGEEVDVELIRPASEITRTIVFSGSHDMTIGVLEDCLRRRAPGCKISATHIGSMGGLLALKRGEAHVIGTHLLDPKTAVYNLPDITRVLGKRTDVLVVNLAVRHQGLIVKKGNPKNIKNLRDLKRDEVRFVNRQPGAGTRVLLDYHLEKLRIKPTRVCGYEREEFTHTAVASAVSSDLADCGLGIKSAAVALDLDFVPVEREEYDLVLRRDFADSEKGQLLLDVMRSPEFREKVAALGGYEVETTGTVKAIQTGRPRRSRSASSKA